MQIEALLLDRPYEIIRHGRVSLQHWVQVRYLWVIRDGLLLRMKNSLRIGMILNCIVMQLCCTLSVGLAQESSHTLLRLSTHGIMTSSPHVATACRDNFDLLLTITGRRLYDRSPVIRCLNDACGGPGLALLSLPAIRMLLLECAR